MACLILCKTGVASFVAYASNAEIVSKQENLMQLNQLLMGRTLLRMLDALPVSVAFCHAVPY